MKKKVAFWGGTFDPPHCGHIGLAKAVLASGRSSRILFVPAFAPPHKEHEAISPYPHRREMLSLALEGEPGLSLCEAEKELGANPSYTFLVMEYLTERFPDTDFQLLIGGDSLTYLHKWYRGLEIPGRWEVLTCPRHGAEVPTREFLRRFWPEEDTQKLLDGVLDTPFFEISSTEVRKRVANNENADNIIPDKVMRYIKQNGLYK